jgi:GTPase
MRREELLLHYPEALQVSARENIGMEALKGLLLDQLAVWMIQRNRQRIEAIEAPDGWVADEILH